MRFSNPNRCDEVTRALAVPGGGGDGDGADAGAVADLAEHLESCPECAAWAERDAALTRLWDATRPVEPGPEAWDAAWARIADRMDAGSGLGTPTGPQVMAFARGRGRFAVGLFAVAQAAALLAALTVALTHRPGAGTDRASDTQTTAATLPEPGPGPDPGRPVRAVALRDTVEVDFDEVVVIREEGSALRHVELPLDDRPNALDGYFAMLGAFESMAE